MFNFNMPETLLEVLTKLGRFQEEGLQRVPALVTPSVDRGDGHKLMVMVVAEIDQCSC